jgi:hypothetical protein
MNVEITDLDRRGQAESLTLKSPKGEEYNMTVYEFSRWSTMLEAVEVINKKLYDLNMPNCDKWVKPIAIQKYIDEKYQDTLFDLLETDEVISD